MGDQAIDQENREKIESMSQEEILQAQKAILEQLGSTHVNALKKFKNNFGKKQTGKRHDETSSLSSAEIQYEEESKNEGS